MSQHSMNDHSGNSYYNSLLADSPVVKQNYSRFSTLADRSKLSFANNTLLMSDTSVNLHDSIVNLSDTIQIGSVGSPSTIQLPNDTQTLSTNEDDLARLIIFESFFELCQKFKQANDVFGLFDLFHQFDEICEENMLVSSKLLKTTVRPEYETNYFNRFSSLVRLERNSWRLIKALLCDRFESSDEPCEEMEIEEDMHLRLSDLELVERTIGRNKTLREMQIVIDWLESIFDDESLENLTFYSNGPQYWENTLHSLKMNLKQTQIGTPSLSKGRTFCTEMDPDASIRTGVPLHDLDKEDENRLFYYVFKLIRGGQLQQAKEISENFGYYWLSAALEGWILYNDPNFSEQESKDNLDDNGKYIGDTNLKQLQPITGNPYRDLWKYSAWKCSKMEGTNIYERAIFAIFSGNRSVLIPHCSKWNDKLWAYFKCSLDVHLENMLLESNIAKPDLQSRINIDLPDGYWDNKLSPTEIFEELDTQMSAVGGNIFNTQIEERYHHIIAKCIILSQIDLLIDYLFEWSNTIQTNRKQRSFLQSEQKANNLKFACLEEESISKTVEPNLLRFFAHLVIGLQNLNLVDDKHQEYCVMILEIYIGFLIEHQLIELVAFYTSFLPENKQTQTFATLLELVDDITDRQLCVNIAKMFKLNLPAIISLLMDNIRSNKLSYQSLMPKSVGGENLKSQQLKLTDTITDNDMRKIHTLDWFLLDIDNHQYVELLWQANALIRSFLLEQKYDQAGRTFEKLPSNIVQQAFEQWQTLSPELRLNLDFENITREYLCHEAYFVACRFFEKWHSFLYVSKPREPPKPKIMTRLADRVAYDQALKKFESEMDEWNIHIKQQATVTSEKILQFLCFPEGVWIDIESLNAMEELHSNVDTESEPRVIEMNDDDVSCRSTEIQVVQEPNLVIQEQLERKKQDWNVRKIQLDTMRRIYVPKFILLLHTVYYDSRNYSECMRIADVVADEQRKLYTTFTKEQMTNLLAKIRESSILILNHSSDPLGCDLS